MFHIALECFLICIYNGFDCADNEEPDISHPDVSVGFESKFDPENGKIIQCQSDIIGTSCTNDGSVCRDPKASDAPDSDKTFSFVITSSAEHSERDTVKLWQPFTSQVPVSSQVFNVTSFPLSSILFVYRVQVYLRCHFMDE